MTVIYTETHLTSDPIYDENNTAIFNVALSNLSIQCQAHRPEHIEYIRRNQIRTGDLIRIRGVFLTPAAAGLPYYIKVSSFVMAPQHQRYTTPSSTALVVRGKKRRVDSYLIYDCLTNSWTADPIDGFGTGDYFIANEEGNNFAHSTPAGGPCPSTTTDSLAAAGTPISASSTVTPIASPYYDNRAASAAATVPTMTAIPSLVANMTEFNGPFNEYFFMMFGEAQYICQCAQMSLQQQQDQRGTTQEIKKQLQQYQVEQMTTINSLLEQIYILFQAMDKSGLNRLDVVNFVDTVSRFVDRLNELQRSCQNIIHEGLYLSQRRIILPSVIYRFYASLF